MGPRCRGHRLATLAPITALGGGAAGGLGAGAGLLGGVLHTIGIPGFASGSWELPSDMIAQVHKSEMIIPAAQADQIRRGNVGGVFGPGRTGGGNAVNVTHAPVINAIDGASVARFYKNNEKQLVRQLNDAARRGVNLGMSKLS